MFHKNYHSTNEAVKPKTIQTNFQLQSKKDQCLQVSLERNDEEWALHESRTAKDEIAQGTEKITEYFK